MLRLFLRTLPNLQINRNDVEGAGLDQGRPGWAETRICKNLEQGIGFLAVDGHYSDGVFPVGV